MLILAFDTTNDRGGVGVFDESECRALIPHTEPVTQHSIILFEMVEQALAAANVELRHIELFAAANGPGSFTGIRVGLAAAQAWGEAFGRPARGVSVLEAMVAQAHVQTDWAFPILDARRSEFYFGSFRRIDSREENREKFSYEASDRGWVLKPDLLRTFVEERLSGGGAATCVVRSHDLAVGSLRTSLPEAWAWTPIEGTLLPAIAALALQQERTDSVRSSVSLNACYIRRPDAEANLVGG